MPTSELLCIVVMENLVASIPSTFIISFRSMVLFLLINYCARNNLTASIFQISCQSDLISNILGVSYHLATNFVCSTFCRKL